MKMSTSFAIAAVTVVLIGLALTLTRPPVDVVQNGYRGTGLALVYNPRDVKTELASSKVPEALPRAPDSGPAAGKVYQNVQVLGDVSVGNFARLMVSITTWVAPQQGCSYCHVAGNFAADTLYTKIVARRMLKMVKFINAHWTTHVGAVGVTCFTCHRGQNIPAYTWFTPDPPHARGIMESDTGEARPAPVAGLSALPFDPINTFLVNNAEIRVQSETALPAGDRASTKQTEWTYALMMHFSQSLGVNCVFCHNSRAFEQWQQSTPQRATAWYGIRMVRALNTQYLGPLVSVLPVDQRGPLGDGPKVVCATCHQGVYKPLFGNPLAQQFPELWHDAATPAAEMPAGATKP
jgi:photosynthetic reaction center cytochrome c subunit